MIQEGHRVPLKGLPIATENIFTNYDDLEPAVIEFTLSSGNKLKLVFPENDACYLICDAKKRPAYTPSEFKRAYNASVGFVPILGPVEHNEQLYQREAARQALLTHNASRNFRNIWYHYPEKFAEFKELIKTNLAWHGYQYARSQLLSRQGRLTQCFVPEESYPREIFWAGFGFQVWCQMLTHIVTSKDHSLLIIDEPDIYLHSELQRQLVDILRQTPPDILIATHSTEIISEADPGDIVVINKKGRSAKRIKNPTQLQSIFSVLGSNLNPTLTQLAKSRRAVFVEGKDFQVLSAFARKVGKQPLANRSDFAVIAVEGFNPARVLNFSQGVELTLGTDIRKAVIFDRDYRGEDEVKGLLSEFQEFTALAHIHQRKEIENYLLDPNVIKRAIERKVEERARRSGKEIDFSENIESILRELSSKMKTKVNAQILSKGAKHLKSIKRGLDEATIDEQLIEYFNSKWSTLMTRLEIVPGKELLSSLNEYLQEKYSISLTKSLIVDSMKKDEVPSEIVDLLERLEKFRKRTSMNTRRVPVLRRVKTSTFC